MVIAGTVITGPSNSRGSSSSWCPFAVGEAESPAAIMDDDVDMVGIIE